MFRDAGGSGRTDVRNGCWFLLTGPVMLECCCGAHWNQNFCALQKFQVDTEFSWEPIQGRLVMQM